MNFDQWKQELLSMDEETLLLANQLICALLKSHREQQNMMARFTFEVGMLVTLHEPRKADPNQTYRIMKIMKTKADVVPTNGRPVTWTVPLTMMRRVINVPNNLQLGR